MRRPCFVVIASGASGERRFALPISDEQFVTGFRS